MKGSGLRCLGVQTLYTMAQKKGAGLTFRHKYGQFLRDQMCTQTTRLNK